MTTVPVLRALAALALVTLNGPVAAAPAATSAAAKPTATIAAAPAAAAEPGAWLRYPALSPDGRQIAFAAQGSLFVVPVAGGTARLLVGNGDRHFLPVWSPDGRHIAYAADTYGNFDIFQVPAEGGPAQRLTAHSAPELPLGYTPDGQAVLFSAHRMDARTSLQFPQADVSELYQVPVQPGRRPVQRLGSPVMAGQMDRAGQRMVYEDLKGYEDPWRKHHVSPVARDIWLWDVRSGQHRKLTTFGGEDRNPVWSPDEQTVYFLSERSGSFNVWKMPLARPEAAEQVTRFATHPVRFLSIAQDGTLAFGHDGEIYTLAPGGQPQRVPVRLAVDLRGRAVERLVRTEGATEVAASPDGQEFAFVLRGEVFVASTEFGDTRRITDTPGQERSVSFSPDGRRLLFAGEHDGHWNLYEARLAGSRQAQPHFFNAAQVSLRTLLKNGQENFQPRYSPDGKEVAYLENRSTLKVLNLASGQARTLLPGDQSYSYVDGDQWFEWSPDGRWLLTSFTDRQRWSNEIGLIDAQGKGPLVNLSRNGYEDFEPRWGQGGRMLYWSSDRQGWHATGGQGQLDVFGLFLTREAFDRHLLDKAEFAQLRKREEEAEKDAEKDSGKKKADGPAGKKAGPAGAKGQATADDTEAPPLPAPVKLELDGLEHRVVRLTPNSGDLRAQVLSPDGETLYFLMASADTLTLWANRPRDKALKKLAEFPAGDTGRGDPAPTDLVLDAQGETGFVLADGQVHHFALPKGDAKGEAEVKPEPAKFSAELNLSPLAERAHLFDHVWRLMGQKLYVQDLGGVDWAGLRHAYERHLPAITNSHDFAELLSEMLGELNVSHTGAGYRPRRPGSDETAALGLFFDETHTGPGLKVAEVLTGGPLDSARSRLRPGQVIESIGGVSIVAGMSVDELLNRQMGKRLMLGVLDPATGQRHDEVVKPIHLREQEELLYRRWVKQQRELVDKLSGGRLGYVHVRGMDDDSFREVYGEALGRHSAKAGLIVDTRYNGGGNLTDDLVTLLSGQRYLESVSRGLSIGFEPARKWIRPTAVLISESNYSDAHLFPWTYQHFKLGPLVGMPVAGTGTAVWWETLQDDSLYFGIPQVGLRDAQGNYMERTLVRPDIEVANDPARLNAGVDQQTEAAVRALLGSR